MPDVAYYCRYCGTLLQQVRIADYWAYICPNKACKEARYPTTRKEKSDGQG
jgi:phage FluMu protein Com